MQSHLWYEHLKERERKKKQSSWHKMWHLICKTYRCFCLRLGRDGTGALAFIEDFIIDRSNRMNAEIHRSTHCVLTLSQTHHNSSDDPKAKATEELSRVKRQNILEWLSLSPALWSDWRQQQRWRPGRASPGKIQSICLCLWLQQFRKLKTLTRKIFHKHIKCDAFVWTLCI